MLEEYALVPDIFDPAAYSKPDYADMCLAHLKEPLLREALVRDLCDGEWSRYCLANSAGMHRLTGELLRKLQSKNRLCRCSRCGNTTPSKATDWCQEAIDSQANEPLSGVIAGNVTKQQFQNESVVCSIEKLSGASWYQNRGSSRTVDRKTAEYLGLLDRILRQANSLMFIDPYLDPTQNGYRDFHNLLLPLRSRNPAPVIELHRSFCLGGGSARVFPTQAEWESRFAPLDTQLKRVGITAEVFLWQVFHDRYLVTDIIGLTVGAGFGITTHPDDVTTWARLGLKDRDDVQRKYDPAARANELKHRFGIGRRE